MVGKEMANLLVSVLAVFLVGIIANEFWEGEQWDDFSDVYRVPIKFERQQGRKMLFENLTSWRQVFPHHRLSRAGHCHFDSEWDGEDLESEDMYPLFDAEVEEELLEGCTVQDLGVKATG